MIKSNIKLGRIRGIEIGANWSWLIIFALVTFSLATSVFPSAKPGFTDSVYAAMAAIATILFFCSLLLHELGHALCAEREGMHIEGITLWLFGGVAKFTSPFPSAGAEFRIAIAGPLVTLVIAALALSAVSFIHLPAAIDGVISWLGVINIVLLVFNMLPGFPLDGGRVLRSTLWKIKDDFLWATKVAGTIGKIFGQLLIAGGIFFLIWKGYTSGLWFAFIGWFLLMAAQSETQMALIQGEFTGMSVANFMVRRPQVINENLSLEKFLTQIMPQNNYKTYPVVNSDNIALGLLVSHNAVQSLAQQENSKLLVKNYMLPLEKVLIFHNEDDLGDATMHLLHHPIKHALVVAGNNELIGLLSITDLTKALHVRQKT